MDGVIRAGQADAGLLGHVIADAFFDLPPSRWLIPDPDARRAVFPRYFRLIVEHALANGTVQTTPDRVAAALWIPVERELPLPPADYLARLAAATGRWADRFIAFDAALDQHHLAGESHHYLALLAVRPDRQDRGIATALLDAYHQQLDQRPGAAAYLEAADERTSRFYLRRGYTLSDHAPFHLPDGGPPMWPMIRRADADAPGGPGPDCDASATTTRHLSKAD